MFVIARLFFYRNPHRVEGWFRQLQFISSAFISLGHGSNDAQKTMGIIAILLFSAGLIGRTFLCSVMGIVSCNFVIALRHMFWWLAYCQNHGHENHQIKTRQRFLL